MANLDSIRFKIKQGDRKGAFSDVVTLLRSKPQDIDAWLLLADLVDEPERKRECYRRILAIYPGHLGARLGLAALEGSTQETLVAPPEPIVEIIHEQSSPSVQKATKQKVTDAEPERIVAEMRENPKERAPKKPKISQGENAMDAIDHAIARAIPARFQKAAGLIGILLILGLIGSIVFMALAGRPSSQTAPVPTPTTVQVGPGTPQPPEERTPMPSQTSVPGKFVPTPGPEDLIPKEITFYSAQETSLSCWRGGTITPLQTFENEIRQVKFQLYGKETGLSADQSLWLLNCSQAEVKPLVGASQILPLEEDPKYEGSRYYPNTLDWSPDGQFMYFDTINSSDVGDFPNYDLYRVEVKSGAVSQMLRYQQGGQPYVSPDGRKVAAAGYRSIWLVNADGSNALQILQYEVHPPATWETDAPPVVWMPDSSAILTAISVEDSQSQDFGKVLTILQITAEDGKTETLGRFSVLGGQLFFSPDGRFVIYRAGAGDAASPFGQMQFAEVSGSKDTPIAQQKNSRFVGWAPDSLGFAYVLEEDQQLYYQAIFDPEGSPIAGTELFPQPFKQLIWLDGRRFVALTGLGFYSGEVGNPLLVLIPGDQGSNVLLAAGLQ